MMHRLFPSWRPQGHHPRLCLSERKAWMPTCVGHDGGHGLSTIETIAPGSGWRAAYFGTTDWFPPGDPGGGITGVVAAPRPDGCTAIPGSTFGGAIVPLCRDN
jgi:hypothetical protein